MFGYVDTHHEKVQRPAKKLMKKKTGALSMSYLDSYDMDDTFYVDEVDYKRRKKANKVRREREMD
jgi:hypothetical protein